MIEAKPLSPRVQEEAAIKAIALSEDGVLLHRYLRRILETVVDFQEVSALYAQNGRRSLARDLMRLMAEGIDDRRAEPNSEPILSRASGPAAVSPRRGAGRRITADTHVASYDDPDRSA